MNKFLWLEEAYTGYCQVCNEPKLVGRVAVYGWPFHGTVCSACLGRLADEIQRRTATFMAQAPGQRFAGAATAAGNGSGPPARTGGNRDEGAPQADGQAGH